MKKIFIFLLSLSVSSSSWSAGIEDTKTYKENPQQQALLKIYWDRFNRSKEVGHDSGAQIAAVMVLLDIEAELLNQGFDVDRLEQLREEASVVYNSKRERDVEDFQTASTRDNMMKLLENIDTISLVEMVSQTPVFLQSYPALLRSFERLKASRLRSDNLDFRFMTGMLLVKAAQLSGLSFSSSLEKRSLDGALRLLFRIVEDSSFKNAWRQTKMIYGVRGLKLRRSLGKNIVNRWEEIYPLDRAKVIGEFWTVAKGLQLIPATVLFTAISVFMMNAPPELQYVSTVSGWAAKGLLGFTTILFATYYYDRIGRLPQSQGRSFLKGCRRLGLF